MDLSEYLTSDATTLAGRVAAGEVTAAELLALARQRWRCLDVTRALSAFGFEARTGLEDGLRATIAWYRTSIGGGV
jgi:nucleoside-diphosphate-sugar epimerase